MDTKKILDGLRAKFPALDDPESRKKAAVMLGGVAVVILILFLNVVNGSGDRKASSTPETSAGAKMDTPPATGEEIIAAESQMEVRQKIAERGRSGARSMVESIFENAGAAPAVTPQPSSGQSVMTVSPGAMPEQASPAQDTPAVPAKTDRERAAEWFGVGEMTASADPSAAGAQPSAQGGQALPSAQPAVPSQVTYQQPQYVQPSQYPTQEYAQGGGAAQEPATSDGAPAADDQTVEVLPSSSIRTTGGISSLDDDWGSLGGVSSLDGDEAARNMQSHPFEVMFSQNEKVTSGGRVMLRLLEEMMVDGVRIPKNSPLSAICTVGDNRLRIVVPALKVNDKIYTLNLVAYDTDGVEGLYCPQSNANRTAKEGRRTAGSLIGSALQTGMAGYAGQVVSSGVQLIQSNRGDVTITVAAGYKFYLIKER